MDRVKGAIKGYLEKIIRTSMAQGRSPEFISTIKWIRTSRLSTKNSLSLSLGGGTSKSSYFLSMRSLLSSGFPSASYCQGERLIQEQVPSRNVERF